MSDDKSEKPDLLPDDEALRRIESEGSMEKRSFGRGPRLTNEQIIQNLDEEKRLSALHDRGLHEQRRRDMDSFYTDMTAARLILKASQKNVEAIDEWLKRQRHNLPT